MTKATRDPRSDAQHAGSAGLASGTTPTWITPLITLIVATLIGVLAGCATRPTTTPQNVSPKTATSEAPTPTLQTQIGAATPAATATPESPWMDIMVAQTRHFIGEPGAPVTIIEFGDFQ